MNQIRDLMKKHNLYLFSDEVYREFFYTGSPYISAMHLKGIEQNVVLIDSVSKRYSECGIRIGALITKNDAVRKTVMKFCQARISPPLIGQIVAEASIEGTEAYLHDVYEEYVERRKCMIDGMNRIPGCYTPLPIGAFFTVAKLPVDDAEKFSAWCLSEFRNKDETTETLKLSGTKGYITYSAVKASMLGILKSLTAELSPKARVNAVLPGGVRTRTTNFLYESQEGPNPRYLLGDN